MIKLSLQIVAILFFNVILLAQEDWFWVNPLPQGNDLNDVFVLDENTIIAVGDRGTLLRSENGGADWEITYRLSNIDEDIVNIQFVSEEKGYLLANDPMSKILLTDDSGINWKVISEFDTIQINDMCFINESIGWIIGTSEELGIILKTNDGGYNWATMFIQNIDYWGFSTIQFIDSLNGWAAGKGPEIPLHGWAQGELLKTNSGGENWNIVYDSLSIVLDLQFINSEVGWIVEYFTGFYTPASAMISKTTDGGCTWGLSHSPPATSWNFSKPSSYFINVDTGWFKWSGHIDKTTDGGISWSTISQNTPSDGGMHFSDELNGCIVGGNGGILTTQNGGDSTWVERSDGTLSDDLFSVDFYNESIGWTTVQGDGILNGNDWISYAKILRTIDAGNSWEEQLNISSDKDYIYMRDIQAVNDQVVYVAGTNVYKTTNGGANWVELFNFGFWDYETLFFLNEDTGFLGGGELYKTTNGGTVWNTVLTIPVESIFFANNSNGWLISGHNIYKTSDEGNNWSLIWTNNLDLKSICFRDENVGLAVGNDGIVVRTLDGGSTWNEIWNKEGYELKSVTLSDSNKAVAVGRRESDGITVSIDNVGGDYSIKWGSWTPGLNDICSNNGILRAVGNAGTIIKIGEGVSFIEEKEIKEIPTNYSLSNNFPNPFNPATKIRYSIPKTSKVIIKIFDILGNEIETLVNEEKQTGTYEITWYAEELPSGIYFYRILAGSFVEIKKMLLLK